MIARWPGCNGEAYFRLRCALFVDPQPKMADVHARAKRLQGVDKLVTNR
jgi:hypothetical protein